MIDAHAHPALILAHVEYAVGNRLAQFPIHEVVNLHQFRLSMGLPLTAAVLERPHQFLLFRVHRNHRLTAMLK